MEPKNIQDFMSEELERQARHMGYVSYLNDALSEKNDNRKTYGFSNLGDNTNVKPETKINKKRYILIGA